MQEHAQEYACKASSDEEWNENDKAFLSNHYGRMADSTIARRLGKTKRNICGKAAEMGLVGIQDAGRKVKVFPSPGIGYGPVIVHKISDNG